MQSPGMELPGSYDCTSVVRGGDPNEMSGPAGAGPELWRGALPAVYHVEFENSPALATAPARDVTVRCAIDSALDVRQVRLGAFGFARMRFDDSRGRTYYTKRLHVADSVGVDVDVAATIDVVQREVVWVFRSIDPATGDVPLDPRAGFLAIEDSLGHGQGFCEFQATPDASAQPYAVNAYADIVFDQNDPIRTNTWTNWIDSAIPTSTVQSASPVDSASNGIVLKTSGSDDESGIASVEVFASTDGADYVDLGSATGDTTIVLPTRAGSTYRVLTQATDAAGNREPLKTAPDLTFTTAVQSPSVHANALAAGWQWISSFVAPSDSTTAALGLAFGGRLTLLKDGAGRVYWPALSVDQIHAWDFRHGYQAYLTAAQTLTLRGRGLVPDTTAIGLGAGWNLAPYVRPTPMRADSALSGVTSQIVIAKNAAGQVYWPVLGINTMGAMVPGEAYKMYMSQGTTLFYPGNAIASGVASKPAPVAPMALDSRPVTRFHPSAARTGSSATLLVEAPGLRDGDEIAAVTRDGRIVGASIVLAGKALVVVWADDAMTPDVLEGPVDGDSLVLQAWTVGESGPHDLAVGTVVDALTGHELRAGVPYHEDAVYRISATGVPVVFSLSQSAPNPFQHSTMIRFGVPRATRVSLELFDVAGHRVRTLVDRVLDPGYHSETLRSDGLASGVYFYRLRAGAFMQSRKLVLMP